MSEIIHSFVTAAFHRLFFVAVAGYGPCLKYFVAAAAYLQHMRRLPAIDNVFF